MGYKKIPNLYKDQTVLMFKRLYATEKIHGTSVHLIFHYNEKSGYSITYFCGGTKYDNFIKLFNEQELIEKATELGFMSSFNVYGEGYGGKMQAMSGTYGKELKFVAFEVKMDGKWMNVPYAEEICNKLGLEFVHYEEIDADPDLIDKLANAPSVQAKRNGIENPWLPREGVVLRPLKEFLHSNGIGRIVAKHKNDLYKEREHQPKIQSPEQLKVLEDAKAIADEWAVPMRLEHIINKLKSNGVIIEEKQMNTIIKAMVKDIYTEAKDEIIESKAVRKAISKKTAKMVITRFKKGIK